MYDASPEHPDGENIFYYLTVYNEPYPQPPAPAVEGLEEGILRGMYRYAAAPESSPSPERPGAPAASARILASGVAVPSALSAQKLLAADWGVGADVWSVTSWTELRRDALAAESHNLLNPEEPARVPYVTSALSPDAGSGSLAGADTPVVAVSDWIRAVPDQIARWVPGAYTSLGTDGYGFSDTRPAARRFFHVDAESIALAVLVELARSGAVDKSLPAQAIAKYKLDLPVSEALS
jgi:pyruvate dehydrogenase E1 component